MGQSGLTLNWGDGQGTDQVAVSQVVEPVSLVMAVDISTSVTDADYNIQREGTALALRNISDKIVEMAESGTPVVLSFVEFNDETHVRVQPTILRDADDVEALAQQIEQMERMDTEGTTLTSQALATATDIHRQVEAQYGPLSRKVTDVSADGFGTRASRRDMEPSGDDDVAEFANAAAQRDIATMEGIEINGIIMPHHHQDIGAALRAGDAQIREMIKPDWRGEGGGLDAEEMETLIRERPELFEGPNSSIAMNEAYYQQNVVNGFTVRAPNAEAYGETLQMKLERELLIGQNDGQGMRGPSVGGADGAVVLARPT